MKRLIGRCFWVIAIYCFERSGSAASVCLEPDETQTIRQLWRQSNDVL